MKSTIFLGLDYQSPTEVEVNTFPGGEVQVKVDDPYGLENCDLIVIYVKLRCAEGIQALAQLKAIMNHYACEVPVNLFLGYAAYSRQDRICSDGEALAAKVFANQINAMKFNQIATVDNHSSVITALLDNNVELTKDLLFDETFQFDFFNKYDVFVAPDFGAAKEVQDLAMKFGKKFVQGVKNRDPKTGQLSGFSHYCTEGDLDDLNVLIIDDIGDGMGTFLGLAEDLHSLHDVAALSLYVTHGIFSKGTEAVSKVFTNVYTTDTLIDKSQMKDFEENIKILSILKTYD